MDFSQKFDLTTKEGWLNAGLLLSGPTGWIPFLIKEMFTDNTEKQVEAAKELIETAKQNGYKHIKFKVNKKAGGELEAAGYGKIRADNGNTVEFEAWT
ncbi:MAG: hypothetical protein K6E14_10325 [Paludibacteraceae bacterium]|nr:hypothetical protein [Paludibacteraceae bacterium]